MFTWKKVYPMFIIVTVRAKEMQDTVTSYGLTTGYK